MQLLIKGGICVNATGRFAADIGVDNGRIVALARDLKADGARVIDAAGKLVLPGVVDAHVHFPWPSASLDSADDFGSGTLAAAHGGVTTVIEYVVPGADAAIAPALDEHLAAAERAAWVDFSFHMILRRVGPDTPDQMAAIVGRGFPSFKIFMAYEGFQLSDHEVLAALAAARELGAVVCFHAEDGAVVNQATDELQRRGQTGIAQYPEAHPLAADLAATGRAINYARSTGCRIHIAHVNTAAGAEMIAQARRDGLAITGETCPHYLTFTDAVYRSGADEAHFYVLAPSFRKEADRAGLWRAIAAGGLQSIATDHCPYTTAQKLSGIGDFRRVPGGAAGVETSLPLLYTAGVRGGQLSLERLVALIATNPAFIFGLYPRKGVIAVGSDADFVIYDEQGEAAIRWQELHSRCDHSLYDGMLRLGRVYATIVRGEVVVEDGELVAAAPAGRVVRRPSSGSARVV